MRFRLLEAPNYLRLVNPRNKQGTEVKSEPKSASETTSQYSTSRSALGSDSRNRNTLAKKYHSDTPALGSESRSKKKEEPKPKQTGKDRTFIPSTPKEWEEVLYNNNSDRAFREIACVKWLFSYRPNSPLCRVLSPLKKFVDIADGNIDQKIDDIETKDANSTMAITKDGEREVVQDKTSRATDKAVETRELQKLVKETEAQRSKLNEIFTSIFTAIDCGSTLFEDVILELDIHRIPSSRYYNLVALASAVAKDSTIDTKKKYLLNTSLYDRETADFNYTLKILDIAHNSSKLSAYYDPKQINVNDLFDGKDVKPAGILKKDPHDISTIFGTVEMWGRMANPEKAKKGADSSGKEKSKHPTFKSFEDAKNKGEDSLGNVVHIDGDFKFDGKDWKPVET